MHDSSILPEYVEIVKSIQQNFQNNASLTYLITQSIIELWKGIYENFPKVISVKIPNYPNYRRDQVASLIAIDSAIDWSIIHKLDYEYFRAVEHFNRKAKSQQPIIIDLSNYNVNNGVYWMDMDVSTVVRKV